MLASLRERPPAVAAGTDAPSAHLSLRSLRKVYDGLVAVDDLTLDVARGELIAFLGPSGCGKTTSLRLVAGLTPATAGRIVVDGRDLTAAPPYRRDMGLVFQSYALFPHLTVTRNVAFGLEMRGIGRAEIADRVKQAIAMVRLSGLEERRPPELSGGQQQRVALARALVIRPSILLFDEPLSNLDAKLRDEMRTEIRDIQKRLGITAIFVTHDQGEALTMCDKVAVMSGGRLEQLGTPQDLYERPASPFVASFVGRINRLEGTGSGEIFEAGGVTLRLPRPCRGAAQVMVRPHRIRVAEQGVAGETGPVNSVTGAVIRSIYSGDIVQSDVECGGQILSVEQSTASHGRFVPVGARVQLTWDIDDTLVFGAAG